MAQFSKSNNPNKRHYKSGTAKEAERFFSAVQRAEKPEFKLFPYIVALMDDEIREAVHADLAPCSDREFFDEYCHRHYAKFGEDFCF